ncbi:hypothetical protein ACFLVN_02185 [Chloroflexota bacterium]
MFKQSRSASYQVHKLGDAGYVFEMQHHLGRALGLLPVEDLQTAILML